MKKTSIEGYYISTTYEVYGGMKQDIGEKHKKEGEKVKKMLWHLSNQGVSF